MVQATPTEIQSSENYKLQKFWEEKTNDPNEKPNIQSMVLKINLLEAGGVNAPREREDTVVVKKE